jgi:hypothetical protein
MWWRIGREEGDMGDFTQEEAEAKIGTCVKALTPLVGVSCGTRGIVTRLLSMPGGYAVIVRWQLPHQRATWFDKSLYQSALVEAANGLDC